MTGKIFQIIFDLDGTLLDTEFEVSRISAALAAEKGCDISPEEVFRNFAGLSSRDKFSGIAKQCGMALSEGDMKELSRRHGEEKSAMYLKDEIPITPGVPEVLRALAKAGHILSVGSSNPSHRSRLGLGTVELLDYFGGRVYGPDLAQGLKKPNPAVFLLAMKENGSAPENTIVIEDSEPGIAAGRAAGAFVIAYLDPRFGSDEMAAEKTAAYKKAGADVVIRDFGDVLKNIPAAPAPRASRPRIPKGPA